jgi:hypothetical protein
LLPALPLALLPLFVLGPGLPKAPPVPPSGSELSVAAPQPNKGTNNAHEKKSLFTADLPERGRDGDASGR